MTRYIILVAVFPLLLIGIMLGCTSQQLAKVQEVTFEQLFLDVEQCSGKEIVI